MFDAELGRDYKSKNRNGERYFLTKGVYISTYGCQMNVNDSDRMYALLEMINYNQVPTPEMASLILINSCSVREKPVHKVYSEVGRYRKLKLKNPDLKIGVAGCVASHEKEKLIKKQPLIDFVIGPDSIDHLPKMIRQMEEGQKRLVDARFDHHSPYHVETLIRHPNVSTFVNITKGCDNFCSFCIVPFTRGRERSRPMSHVIKDINALCLRGVKEVTVLGQNVNSYLSDCGADFADLLENLSLYTDLERIRFTTSHPKDFNQKLMKVMAKYRHKICEYIHLPVQSGSTEILARMNRGYSREDYLNKVDMIRDHIPDVVLSTDIIIGFPGETAEQFEQTMDLLNQVHYENIYAFSYSPRPYTKASKYEDGVSSVEKSERLSRLIAFHREQSFELAKRYQDQRLQVLVEHWDQEHLKWTGRSTQNKLVHFSGGEDLVGKTVPVLIEQIHPQTLRGVFQQ